MAQGAYLLLDLGLPPEVVHGAFAHPGSGKVPLKTVEGLIIHPGDLAKFEVLNFVAGRPLPQH